MATIMFSSIIQNVPASDAQLRVFKHKRNTTETIDLNYWTPDYFVYTPYKISNTSTYYYNTTTSNETVLTYLSIIDPEGDTQSYENYLDSATTNYTLATAPAQWEYHQGTETWLTPVAGDTAYDVKTEIDLLTGSGSANKTTKYILLSVTASRREYILDPNDPYSTLIEFFPISHTEIEVLNKTVDTNNNVFLKSSYNQAKDVTPQVNFSTYSNHVFSIAVVPIKLVNLTRTFHPKFLEAGDGPTLADLQSKFDEGTEGLARDDDDSYAINDPSITESTNSASLYRSDDVPTYVEFVLSDVIGLANTYTYTNQGQQQVIQTTNKAVFPAALHGPQYFDVSTVNDRTAIFYSGYGDIRQVNSLIGDVAALGYTSGLGVKNPTKIIVPISASASTLMHEWGHAAGLPHRGDGANYGPGANAVMENSSSDGWEVNRYERGIMLSY